MKPKGRSFHDGDEAYTGAPRSAACYEREIRELRRENEELRALNAKLDKALSGYVSRPLSNTDAIMGAILSGGDARKLAEDLAANQKNHDEKSGRAP